MPFKYWKTRLALIALLGVNGWILQANAQEALDHKQTVYQIVDAYFAANEIAISVSSVAEEVINDAPQTAEHITAINKELEAIKADAQKGLQTIAQEAYVKFIHVRVISAFARMRSILSRMNSALMTVPLTPECQESLKKIATAIDSFFTAA
jgi:hypothetical protein